MRPEPEEEDGADAEAVAAGAAAQTGNTQNRADDTTGLVVQARDIKGNVYLGQQPKVLIPAAVVLAVVVLMAVAVFVWAQQNPTSAAGSTSLAASATAGFGTPTSEQNHSPGNSSSVFALCRATTAEAPSGWRPVNGVQITAGADPGAVCITQSGSTQFSGLYLPHVSTADYSVSVRGRLASGSLGWGLAARAVWSGGSVYGHAIQYDPGADGYQDTDYPTTRAATIAASTDNWWHTLTVTVRSSQYTLLVDGAAVAQGQLSETGDGAYIRVWNGGTVELGTPTVELL